MKIPGLDDMVEEIRQGRDTLVAGIGGIAALLEATNELLAVAVEKLDEVADKVDGE